MSRMVASVEGPCVVTGVMTTGDIVSPGAMGAVDVGSPNKLTVLTAFCVCWHLFSKLASISGVKSAGFVPGALPVIFMDRDPVTGFTSDKVTKLKRNNSGSSSYSVN